MKIKLINKLKNFSVNLPGMKELLVPLYYHFFRPKYFENSYQYWNERYKDGGTSGDGSFGKLSKFKADIINSFILNNNPDCVVEFGCGDGNQLTLANYPSYIGLDISEEAIKICSELFKDDTSKKFILEKDYKENHDISISLDVIYHIIEDSIYENYMHKLFNSTNKFIIIYSSNFDDNPKKHYNHVRHRKFTNWIEENAPKWKLTDYIRNEYPYNGEESQTSLADFYFYKKHHTLNEEQNKETIIKEKY
tara:strand:+ start:2146 stop:2895 length:750 start_codon:yes stop_codon:yes gene_type:complete